MSRAKVWVVEECLLVCTLNSLPLSDTLNQCLVSHTQRAPGASAGPGCSGRWRHPVCHSRRFPGNPSWTWSARASSRSRSARRQCRLRPANRWWGAHARWRARQQTRSQREPVRFWQWAANDPHGCEKHSNCKYGCVHSRLCGEPVATQTVIKCGDLLYTVLPGYSGGKNDWEQLKEEFEERPRPISKSCVACPCGRQRGRRVCRFCVSHIWPTDLIPTRNLV